MSVPGAEQDQEQILRDLASSDEEVRRLAVERLLCLPAAECVPRLVECLGDPGWRVRKAAVGRLVACAETDQVVAALSLALADGENPGRRNAAVEALVELGEPAVPRLLETLGSDDVDVRKFAVDALAGIGSAATRDALVARLGDPDPNVRAAAADALGVVGGEAAVWALHQAAVDGDEDRLVCFSALRALSRLEAPLAAADLAPALDDPTLRPAAFSLLGRRDDDEALDRLLKGLGSGSRAAREAAMEAVLRLLSVVDGERARDVSERVRETVHASTDLLEAVRDRIDDADLTTRLVLVQFLGLVGSEACVLPVLRAGRDEAIREVALATLEHLGEVAESALDASWGGLDPELRCEACVLLGRIPGPRGAARLRASLDDEDAELRTAAARALGSRREAAAIPDLVRRLEACAASDDFDAAEEVDAVVDALVLMASTERPVEAGANASRIIELLADRLEGAPDPVRLSIARVLGRIGRPDDVDLVVHLQKDASSAVRRAAVEALSRLETGSASEPLRLALADESPQVRVAAAAALGASRSAGAIDDLRRLLHDEDERVRSAAVRAIGALSQGAGDGPLGEEALELLRASLHDAGVVAMAAAEALRSVGGAEAAEAARDLLARSEPELVQAAVGVLARHGSAEAVEDLLALVPHESWSVRAEAIQTLAERGVVKAIPPILRRLETEQDDFVRETMLRALKKLEGRA